jgi:8-oxo-dGTP diphosphatase
MAPTGADPIRIETARLILRSPRKEDAPVIERYVSEADVALPTANIPHPYPEGGALQWMAQPQPGPSFVITRKDDGALIGGIVLDLSGGQATAELGYWIGKPFWGRGYATESVRALIAYGFARHGLRAIEAGARATNSASIRVQEKAGMGLDREERRSMPARGTDEIHPVRRINFEQWCAANPVPTVLVAAVALVDGDGRVLIAQRPEGKSMAGLWEFPGGKVAEGETPESALIRELKEEIGIDTIASCLAPFTFASRRYEDFHLLMPLYLCRKWQGEVRALEHAAIKWVRPARLGEYDMPPADKPLIAMLRDFL